MAAAPITWSSPKCDGRWRKPASLTRKKFAVAAGHCCGGLLAPTYPEDSEDAPALEIAVFLERRENGGSHFHAAPQDPRGKIWRHPLGLLRDRRIASGAQIGVGRVVRHIDNTLRYCIASSAEKLEVEGFPLSLARCIIPPVLLPPINRALRPIVLNVRPKTPQRRQKRDETHLRD